MSDISVVISAYNEEENIVDCIQSVKDIANEVIVVDNNSEDRTAEIAKKAGAVVFQRENNPMLNVNKNFGFSKAKSKWILCLDADERVSDELAWEIKQIKKNENAEIAGYLIPRKNIIFKKWIQNSIWWPDYHLRLFLRGKGKYPEVHVHEYIVVDGSKEKLQSPLIHQSYSSISEYVQKLDKIYTENEVKVFLKDGKKVYWHDALRFPFHDFLKTFFLQKGYKDGLHGLVLSMLQAFYMFIVFAKMWEQQGFPENKDPHFLKEVMIEVKKMNKELEYWKLTAKIEHTENIIQKNTLRVIRKIKQNT